MKLFTALIFLAACGARSELDSTNITQVDAAGGASACRVSSPTVLATTVATAGASIVVDDVSVYWINPLAIHAVDKSGMNARTVVTIGGGNTTSWLSLVGSSLYWSTSFDTNNGLFRASTAGGSGADMLSDARARELAIRGDDVYWINNTSVERLLGGQTTSQVIATGEPTAITTNGDRVFWTALTPNVKMAGTVTSYDPTSNATLTLASGLVRPIGIACDSTMVYFGQFAPNEITIEAVDTSGDAVNVLATTPAMTAIDCGGICDTPNLPIAVSGGYVYFASPTNIFKVPTKGGSTIQIASAQQSIVDFTVDDACAYWIDGDAIMMGPK